MSELCTFAAVYNLCSKADMHVVGQKAHESSHQHISMLWEKD